MPRLLRRLAPAARTQQVRTGEAIAWGAVAGPARRYSASVESVEPHAATAYTEISQ